MYLRRVAVGPLVEGKAQRVVPPTPEHAKSGAWTWILRNLGITLAAPTGFAAVAAAGEGTFAAGTYHWLVSATREGEESLPSTEVSAAVELDGHAALSWTAVTGATGYRIYRATVAEGEYTSPAFVAAVSTTSYKDTGTAVSAGSALHASTAAQPIELVDSLTKGLGEGIELAHGESLTVTAGADEIYALVPSGSAPLAVIGAAAPGGS
ncbi:MAG: hypothetical protein KGL39_42245 [Patescibacteria group bacterium]|nr:hypothetical protein [Patescibacteria group bacterium]